MLTIFPGQSQVFLLGWHLGLDTARNYPWTLSSFNGRNPIPTATIAPGTISANTTWESSTINCYGALAGIPVSVGPPSNIAAGLTWSAYCSATDTIKLRISNPTCPGSPYVCHLDIPLGSQPGLRGREQWRPSGQRGIADEWYSIMKCFES